MAKKRPNVLFVVFDQMRADCLTGALGEAVDLPNLRALMADATVFTNHVTVTCPCGPARASLLTGQYAMNHRSVRNGTPLPADKLNLATELRGAGVQPLLYGYTDTSQDPRRFPPDDPVLTSYEQVMNGFMEVIEMRFEEDRVWRAHLSALGYDVPEGQAMFVPDGDRPDSPAMYSAEHSDTAYLTDRLLEDLPSRGDGWCALVTYIRPHPPFVAPAPYNGLCSAAGTPPATVAGPPEEYRKRHPFNGPAMEYKRSADMVEGFPGLGMDADTTAMLRAVYLGLVAELDHHFGRIIAHLKDTGRYDDTLIVVTSDHAEMLGDHHSWGKVHYFDSAFRVPLVIRLPSGAGKRAAAGTRVDSPTESVDVTPTILDLLGVPVPDSMDGASLAPFLKGKPPPEWRTHSVSEVDFGDPVNPTVWQRELGLGSDRCGLTVIRSDTHNLVQFGSDSLPPLLFDREADGENRDIAMEPASAGVRLELAEALLRHRMNHAEGQFSRVMVTSDGVVRGDF